jgi:hypothetical protein
MFVTTYFNFGNNSNASIRKFIIAEMYTTKSDRYIVLSESHIYSSERFIKIAEGHITFSEPHIDPSE